MWHMEQLQEHLKERFGRDVWTETILPRMNKIVVNTVKLAQDKLSDVKGHPMELFGYDIMIDDEFNPWLLEVNSSPTLEYSTPVTTELSKQVMASIVEILLREMKKKYKGDTGPFKCIFKGKRKPPP